MPESFQLMFARIVRLACRSGLPLAIVLTLTPVEASAIIEDWTEERKAEHEAENYRTASLLAMQANCHRKKGKPPLKPEDFLPRRAQSPEEVFWQIAKATGATIARN